MIMNKRILYLFSLMGLLSFAACTNEENSLLSNEVGEICFAVSEEEPVQIETRASFDVNKFNVSLKRGSELLFSDRKYSDIAGTSYSYSAGKGYLFTAESCTESEAESANSKWGKARAAGEESFEVIANQNNNIEVTCKQVNASVQVGFSDFIKKLCPEYAITFYAADDDVRQFTIDQDNYSYRTAYFNVNESRALNYKVTLTYSGEKHEFADNYTLLPSSNYQLNIKLSDESISVVSIGISVNGELVDDVKMDPVIINPYEDTNTSLE